MATIIEQRVAPIKRSGAGLGSLLPVGTNVTALPASIAGNSTRTDSVAASSGTSSLPVISWLGPWSQFPGRAATFIANDINGGFQVTYDTKTGQWAYSNPYAGNFVTGNSLSNAVNNYEAKYNDVPLATLQAILGVPAATTNPTTTTTPVATSTAPETTTDPTAELLAALPALLSSAGGTTDGTDTNSTQPTVVPVTSGTGSSTSGASVALLVLILIVVGVGGYLWWKHAHHHAAPAA